MAIIYTYDLKDETGKERNMSSGTFGFSRTISPVMNGITLAVTDTIALFRFQINDVVDINITHTQSDATLAGNLTYAAFDDRIGTIKVDNNGDPIIMSGTYFGLINFTTARSNLYSPYIADQTRRTKTIKDGLKDLGVPMSTSPSGAVMVLRLTAIPTGTVNIAFSGFCRGY